MTETRIGSTESNDIFLEYRPGDSGLYITNLVSAVPDSLVEDTLTSNLPSDFIKTGSLAVTYNGANGWVVRARALQLLDTMTESVWPTGGNNTRNSTSSSDSRVINSSGERQAQSPGNIGDGSMLDHTENDRHGASISFLFHDHEIIWYGQTHLIVRGIERLIPNLKLVMTAEHGQELCHAAGIEFQTAAEFEADREIERSSNLIAFEWTDDLVRLAETETVLMPTPTLVAKVASKASLPLLLGNAGVNVIPSLVLDPKDPWPSSQDIWNRLMGPTLVVQQEGNTLNGRGTHRVVSVDQLDALLAHFAGEDLKVSRFIDGELVTSAANVGRGGCITQSCCSRQLVGMPQLTGHWASHCGNEIVTLDPEVRTEVQKTTQRVAQHLAELGYLGVFGLDLIVTDAGEIYTIEINPRFQSVTSLKTASELANKYIPLSVHHIAAYLGIELPEEPNRPTELSYSQMCLYNFGPAFEADAMPKSGVYDLDVKDGLKFIGPDRDLVSLSEKTHVLVTMRASDGDEVPENALLAYIQRRGAICGDGNNMLPDVDAFLTVFRQACGITVNPQRPSESL